MIISSARAIIALIIPLAVGAALQVLVICVLWWLLT